MPCDAGDLAHLRAHGRNADDELHEIADRAHRLVNDAADVRLMCGNGAYAMNAAERMRALLGQSSVSRSPSR